MKKIFDLKMKMLCKKYIVILKCVLKLTINNKQVDSEQSNTFTTEYIKSSDTNDGFKRCTRNK